MNGDGIKLRSYWYWWWLDDYGGNSDWTSHIIDERNTVNGKPVYYWVNRNNGTIPPGAGQVILANCSNITVADQDISNVTDGIQLGYSSYINIINNSLSDNDYCIYLVSSNNNIVAFNKVSNSSYGIYFDAFSINNLIENNIALYNTYAVSINYMCEDNIINNNKIRFNFIGIIFENYCINNTVANNKLQSNSYLSIYLGDSYGTIVINNSMSKGGISIGWSSIETLNSHTIDSSNKVYDKPVIYWKDRTGGIVPTPAGQIILINCSNVIVEDQWIDQTSTGIQIIFSDSITIRNNIIYNNYQFGIELAESSNIIIENNHIAKNYMHGISIWGRNFIRSGCNNITIMNNNISYNYASGIYLRETENNRVEKNNIIYNEMYGINLESSPNGRNIIAHNFVSGNSATGIEISSADGNTFSYNIASYNNRNGIALWDARNNLFMNNILESNHEAGLNLTSGYSNQILNNTFSSSKYGIFARNSQHNMFSSNKIMYNEIGFSMNDGNNNEIFFNNFLNNKNHAYSNNSINQWNDDYPFGGNFWSGYNGADIYHGKKQDIVGSDGFGDEPYYIEPYSSDIIMSLVEWDKYPLMKPVTEFFIDSAVLSPLPTPPQNLQAEARQDYVKLTWDAPRFHGQEPIFGYKIYRGTSAGNETFITDIIDPELTEFIDTEIIPEETYFYKVTAENWNGESEYATINITTPETKSNFNSEEYNSEVYRYLFLAFLIFFVIIFMIIRSILRTRTKTYSEKQENSIIEKLRNDELNSIQDEEEYKYKID
jgi:parallel beta-helix repeat protein